MSVSVHLFDCLQLLHELINVYQQGMQTNVCHVLSRFNLLKRRVRLSRLHEGHAAEDGIQDYPQKHHQQNYQLACPAVWMLVSSGVFLHSLAFQLGSRYCRS